MKNKIYLDTSVPSAYFDTSKPLRQLITQKWFINDAVNFLLFTSIITYEEISQLKNDIKRANIENLLFEYDIKILDLNEEIKNLADKYISSGAIPKTEPEDAYHIATATISKIHALASWNFKHIVSLNPIKKIHEINRKCGYNIIEIGSLEIFGGAKYGSI